MLVAPILLAATLALKPDHGVAATFDPERAIRATIDAHGREETASIFTPPNTEAMLSTGFRSLSHGRATEAHTERFAKVIVTKSRTRSSRPKTRFASCACG